MKAIAYSIKPFEREPLLKANNNRHEIAVEADFLHDDTVHLAAGRDAVIVAVNDDVSASVIAELARLGVRFIATRSTGTDHIDLPAALAAGLNVANVAAYSPEAIAEHAAALAFALARKIVPAAVNARNFDFRISGNVGFNFKGKTVGVIGLGAIGTETAKIFGGMGCHVIAHDKPDVRNAIDCSLVDLPGLLAKSDVISLHVPLNQETRHMIRRETIALMKHGVMLINTSRGAVINTPDLLPALEDGQIGYFGTDVYEFERGLFYYDHSLDPDKDLLLLSLLRHPNVLVTPHQAFLTLEALAEIAQKTIGNLDAWAAEL